MSDFTVISVDIIEILSVSSDNNSPSGLEGRHLNKTNKENKTIMWSRNNNVAGWRETDEGGEKSDKCL